MNSKKKKKNKKKDTSKQAELNTQGTKQSSQETKRKKRQHPDSKSDTFSSSKIPKLKDNRPGVGKFEVIFPSNHASHQSIVHSNGKNHVDLSNLGQFNQPQNFYPSLPPQPLQHPQQHSVDFMNHLSQPVYNIPNFLHHPHHIPSNLIPIYPDPKHNIGLNEFPTFPKMDYPYIGSEGGLPPNQPLPSNLFPPVPNVHIPTHQQNTFHPNLPPFSHQNAPYQPQIDPVVDQNVSTEKDRVLIVLDTANLCFSHGKGNVFSIDGFMIAYNYYKKKGYKVVGFIASYYIRTQKHQVKGNWEDLERLIRENVLILTPPQDYDDSYMLEYAKRHRGYIVSNDMYRDHLQKFKNEKQRERMRDWIKKHTISFTFIQDEFLPNPDAKVPKVSKDHVK